MKFHKIEFDIMTDEELITVSNRSLEELFKRPPCEHGFKRWMCVQCEQEIARNQKKFSIL